MQWANTRLQLLAFPFTVFSSIVPVLVALLGVVSAGSWGSFLSCYLPESFFAPTVGFLGLAATYAMMLPSAASEIVLCTASLDKSMCSVQRLKELLESIQNSATTQHNKSQTDSSAIIQNLSDMPTQRTGLVLSHVEVAYRRVVNDASTSASGSVQYAPTYYPPSLIDISIKIQPGDHVGIVGRTGAGKFCCSFKARFETATHSLLFAASRRAVQHSQLKRSASHKRFVGYKHFPSAFQLNYCFTFCSTKNCFYLGAYVLSARLDHSDYVAHIKLDSFVRIKGFLVYA